MPPIRAHAHGLPQPRLVGQVPGEGAGHPAANVIKGPSGLGEIEHRLLHLGPRRIGVALNGLESTSGPVNDDPGHGHDPALDGNGQVDHLGELIREPMQFSCRLVTETRTRAGPQDRRPQPRPAARHPGEGRVNTGMNLPPSATAHPELDHAWREAAPHGLRAGDDAGLIPN
jgi:hypothetical protein